MAPTFVFLFYHLASHPRKTQRLRQELLAVNQRQPITVAKLITLPYLNAFINETLRLFPTTPTGGLRESPPEGLRVAGRWIPPNITIVAPAYCIGRRELRLIFHSCALH